MEIKRVSINYAWGICEALKDNGDLCGNTVKFGDSGTVSCCPACSSLYQCDEEKAEYIGITPEKMIEELTK